MRNSAYPNPPKLAAKEPHAIPRIRPSFDELFNAHLKIQRTPEPKQALTGQTVGLTPYVFNDLQAMFPISQLEVNLQEIISMYSRPRGELTQGDPRMATKKVTKKLKKPTKIANTKNLAIKWKFDQ